MQFFALIKCLKTPAMHLNNLERAVSGFLVSQICKYQFKYIFWKVICVLEIAYFGVLFLNQNGNRNFVKMKAKFNELFRYFGKIQNVFLLEDRDEFSGVSRAYRTRKLEIV